MIPSFLPSFFITSRQIHNYHPPPYRSVQVTLSNFGIIEKERTGYQNLAKPEEGDFSLSTLGKGKNAKVSVGQDIYEKEVLTAVGSCR